MASPLPPTITKATGSDGTDVINNGQLSSNSITFTGTGFPSVTLKITLTVNGSSQPPSIANIVVDSAAKWSATLDNLPSGSIVVTFTEDTNNPVVAIPPGSVSWSFKASTGITENFNGEYQIFYHTAKFVTKKGVFIFHQAQNTSYIRNAREFRLSPLSLPKSFGDDVFCFSYFPEDPSLGKVAFSFVDSNEMAITCSKVNFKYICQTPCVARFQDSNAKIIQEQSLIVSGAPQAMTQTGDIAAFYIYETAPPSRSKTYSALISEIVFTPT